MKPALNARRLRLVLVVIILLLLVAACGGFIYAQKNLKEYAIAISQSNADALSGDTNIRTLKALESKLTEESDTIEDARSIVADSSTYADQSLADLSKIARDSGVEITSFGFIDSGSSSTTAPATGTTAPAASGSPVASGVSKKSISIEIKSPLSYTSFMKFLRGIETNKLKMQLTNVSLTKGEGSNVSTPALTIEVYVRQ